ncbi:E3 ubiquitin-protein ligase Bre1-like isoform X1 [Daphnia pulex]|uniref:E3 ubiquitin-protein ligase Bre1-like isoform X1 n=1 Tax=Daphnia pulex TaxID=6669 RepID=UPI001EDE86CB|nr:E3 ubiquitin-protein ligase Bre1-like isoform X1 [Daphnia pulex]XP_046446399.1 E3 ubiquitin-protein ligase Bre1-like isoform X1 [Daphnia pulex]XP_046634870.1 E3 ubiquitin-protein ligase Bre1-like isoform X1 [Daphnia pulicaria]XP_046634871.1 E3 ubiquitin-protein ligase Bre1-like isoform X1 [Daphnia pulicaria]
MSKRPAEDSQTGGSSGPQCKKVQFEPIRLGAISSLEEMDMKVLQFQNKKLSQRLELRQRTEAELRQRIEQLEKRQMQDDAVLNVINRYWNQLNEDVRILLQRFDAETADENESKNESEATTSFLALLSTWDKDELDEKLANRVLVSQRAVAKLIRAFDRLLQRNEKVTQALKGESDNGEVVNLEEAIKQVNAEIQAENSNLHVLNTSLHEKNHAISLKLKEMQEQLTAKETEAAELQNRVDDLDYELQKRRHRADSLENHLGEALEKIKVLQQQHQAGVQVEAEKTSGSKVVSVSQKKMEDQHKELEEQREMAANRLAELDRLHQNHRDVLQQLEHLKMDIRQLPESVVVETTEYKCLQSQFSVLYNDSMGLKTQLDEARQQWHTAKNAHLRQIELMESDELLRQKQLRTEVIQLEDMLAQVRKEYEMLRIEFEQQLAANEQTGPINREMRHLITSLQNHNQQLKGEVHRYRRRKYRETSGELAKTKRELEESQAKVQALQEIRDARDADAAAQREAAENADTTDSTGLSSDTIDPTLIKDDLEIKREPDDDSTTEDTKDDLGDIKKEKSDVKKEPSETKPDPAVLAAAAAAAAKIKEQKNAEAEVVRDLKAQLKKAHIDQREMKLLLDMYKGVGKETRDKTQLMAAERKARLEIDDLKQQLKKMQASSESKREERKRLADDEAVRKIRSLEEGVHQLQKQVAAQKQEEEALLNEMEVTGQAFEDMQEQNSRLIQQLREKDDANFKLMSERIKAQQVHKLQREEKDMLVEQVSTLNMQVEAQNQVVRRLEEKERLLQSSITCAEKELMLRQQAMEMHKRKAIESAQSAADLKLHLEKYHSQMKEAQQVVAEKTGTLEAEAYKTRRLYEELAQVKRRVERLKKIEAAGTADEVLREELREYKDTLTCPSCKVTRKDAVLTKCFHVFCFDCLRTRYETRQRKCPKCNAAFGANDYHRLYLS